MARKKEFNKEIDVEKFICTNIESFCHDILCDEYISHVDQFVIGRKISPEVQTKRIDVFINAKKRNYIVEVKNPESSSDNISAIGQVLNYGRQITDSKKETDLIIITTFFDKETHDTIKHFNLPIRYMEISKERLVEYT